MDFSYGRARIWGHWFANYLQRLKIGFTLPNKEEVEYISRGELG